MHTVFAKVILQVQGESRSCKGKALTDMPPPKTKKSAVIPGCKNYLSELSSHLQSYANQSRGWHLSRLNRCGMDISRDIWKTQVISKRSHMHEILLCQEAAIPGSWCTRSRCRCCTAGEGKPKLWICWNTRQHNALFHHICQQEPIQHGVAIRQYRKRGTWNSALIREVSPLLLCTWSTCHSQATNHW